MANAWIQPYLFFAGRCEEALAFYHETLGAEVGMMMRYKDSPEPPPPSVFQAGLENKIMHCAFRVGSSWLMASDGCEHEARFSGFSLSLALDSESEATRIFRALAERGEIQMALGKTFWCPCFGMVKDCFGISWMIKVEKAYARPA